VDSIEGSWNTGRDEEGGNKGYKPRTKGGYFPVPPMDHYTDLRSEMVHNLEAFGIQTQLHHHEVGSGGQGEIGIQFDTLAKIADKLMTFKYVVKNTGAAAGKTVTFMPKPIFGDNGSGMHTHQSLWKDGEPLFFDESGYGQLSDTARWYIGGLLAHAQSILAFTNPTTNSYRRLVPGYEAPVNLVYSAGTARRRCASRSRVRTPRPSASSSGSRTRPQPLPRLRGDADGRDRRGEEPIEPPDPVDKDIYDLPPEELTNLPAVPRSLEEALDGLA
jgi:glutamine synthetase